MGLSYSGGSSASTSSGVEVTATGGVTCAAGTAVANVDVLVYTVPASPTTPARFLCTAIALSLRVALVGAGSVVVTCGTTAGGTDLMTAQTITSATALSTAFGLAQNSLGTAFSSATMYNALLAPGTTIYVRLATTGTVTTAPSLQAHVLGVNAL